MKKRKLIPLIVMLLSGLISTLISMKMHYDVTKAMIVILVSMLIFYGIGLAAGKIIDVNVVQMEEREAEKLREEEERRLEEEALLAEAGAGMQEDGDEGNASESVQTV